jgi:hypothetical protein
MMWCTGGLFVKSQFQAKPNPAKPEQARAKKIKEKALDFHGFSLPNRAFSTGYTDP